MFKGTTKAVFVDRREYTGPLWEQIDEAFQFVLRNIHLGATIVGIYRQDIYEIPPDAIRELIINAMVHRSYLDHGTIQVAVYDNRLEITSPGKLPDCGSRSLLVAKLICVSIFIEVRLTALLTSMPSITPLNRRETADKVPTNEQEQQIYKYVSENVGITTAQAMKLLGIKQRRTREILVKMVENGWLRKEGASRSTIYVKNTEGR